MINLGRNKLLNQITYLSVFKINKMPKTMNSVMFFLKYLPFDIISSLPMVHYYGDLVVPEHCVKMCKK